MTSISVCTIIAKNYLALAKTLAKSFQKFHPNVDFRCLIVDPFNPSIKSEELEKIIIDCPANFLQDSLINEMAYTYDITEFSTALKPFYLEHLLEQGYEKVIYLDPDILILQPLDKIFQALDDSNILLIPHLLEPIPFDDHLPTEITILQSGTYNLGFIGISKNQETLRFLSWWKERLKEHCYIAIEKGLFVDQKWIDLVPGMFQKVKIFRERGYNVAYWNFHSRYLSQEGDTYLVDGEPLVFFHFSGFNPDNLKQFSKHETRFQVEKLPTLKKLLQEYANYLEENNHHQYKKWSYGYGTFSNNVAFDSVGRYLLRQAKLSGMKFADPYNVEKEPSFFTWLNSPVKGSNKQENGILTNYFYGFYQRRADLQVVFPDVLNQDCNDYLLWISQNAEKEKVAPYYIEKALGSNQQQNDNNPFVSGVNIAGYLTAELGIGEAARGYVTAMKSLGTKIALLDFSAHTLNRKEDNTLSDFDSTNPYPINLVCINADQVSFFANQIGLQYFEGKHNIGLWAWELPNFPQEWVSNLSYFNEIWVGSNFMYHSIIKESPIPVVTIPHVVEVSLQNTYSKEYFGFSNKEYIFLFSFDFFSIFQRKNPLDIVEAFKIAFPTDEPVRLVLKCINGEDQPENLQILKDAINDPRITLMDKYLSKDEKNGLMSVCDCYISLHRSEGFGLTLAEAMFLEKPVIATGWSGNMDFMTTNNSYPVEYDLVELTEDYGPYKKGQIWAQPKLHHAAEMMRYVYEYPTEAQKKAKRAAADIRTHNSAAAVAEIIKKRLNVIEQSKTVDFNTPQIQLILAKQKRLQEEIAAMKTSKFWKIRNQWFKLKKVLGLHSD